MDALCRVPGFLARALKGMYLSLMFLFFGIGIVVGEAVVCPTAFLLRRTPEDRFAFVQAFFRFAFRPFLWLLKTGGLVEIEAVSGRPMNGPCILVANHPGLFDVLYMIVDVRDMVVLAKDSLFRYMGVLLRGAGYVRVSRESRYFPSRTTMDEMQKRLEAGFKVLVFPEGTRSPVGGLLAFRTMAAEVAVRANIPIQPVVIHNIPPFLPKGARWYYPLRQRCSVRLDYLEPVEPKGKPKEMMQRIEHEISVKLDLRRMQSGKEEQT